MILLKLNFILIFIISIHLKQCSSITEIDNRDSQFNKSILNIFAKNSANNSTVNSKNFLHKFLHSIESIRDAHKDHEHDHHHHEVNSNSTAEKKLNCLKNRFDHLEKIYIEINSNDFKKFSTIIVNDILSCFTEEENQVKKNKDMTKSKL